MSEDLDLYWYRCENDFCLRFRVPTDLLPGEEAICDECGAFMNAMDLPPGLFG